MYSNEVRVACVVPTYNGFCEIQRLAKSLSAQTAKFDLLVVDSNSTDGTAEFAMGIADSFRAISASEFNHGGTRQLMVNEFAEYEIFVFLTQDACVEEPDAVAKLVEVFRDGRVGAVCGRQIPHDDADIFSRFARSFNYSDVSRVVDFSDVPVLGLKSAFMSNSFAGYRRDALMQVGGFPRDTIFAEDMYVAAKLLLGGWKVAYSAEARCKHSHNYSLGEEFRRYFDIGVFHSREPWLLEKFSGVGSEGVRYVVEELRALGFRRLGLWPYALMRSAVKLIGYKAGKSERSLPVFLKRRLSMHKRYWDKEINFEKANLG